MGDTQRLTTDTGAFTIIPEWVLDNKQLAHGAVRLYGVLARYADTGGRCWPSRETLARRVGCSKGTIDRFAESLVTVGALIIERRKTEEGKSNMTNIWVIHRVAPSASPPGSAGKAPRAPLAARRTRTSELDKEQANENIAVVWSAWVESTGKNKTRTQLDTKREKLIAEALHDYPVADVVAAVTGWKHSPHHRGENERNTIYNSLSLLLRNPENIERFRDLHPTPRPEPIRVADVVAEDKRDTISRKESAKQAAKIRENLRK